VRRILHPPCTFFLNHFRIQFLRTRLALLFGNSFQPDDSAGHLAHNANLSIKAILALDSYAVLAGKTGHPSDAIKYHTLARQMSKRWTELALDGDHFRLAFDKPGTWSQKYNLVWGKIVDLNILSPTTARTELRFYKAHLNEFGLPLDNRSAYTKLDLGSLDGNPGRQSRELRCTDRPTDPVHQ
jgi:hypothetical protein